MDKNGRKNSQELIEKIVKKWSKKLVEKEGKKIVEKFGEKWAKN